MDATAYQQVKEEYNPSTFDQLTAFWFNPYSMQCNDQFSSLNLSNPLPEEPLLDPAPVLSPPLDDPLPMFSLDQTCLPLVTANPEPVQLSHVDSAVALNIPSSLPRNGKSPKVTLHADKLKTRAETQIKMRLVLDPLGPQYERIRFPKKTLAKSKLFATDQEKAEFGKRGTVVMDCLLVLATAVEDEKQKNRALKRARGEEPIPRRPANTPLSELDKSDPAHPQNGGEVVICQGCKEREEKRSNRKKKREDECHWEKYGNDRVILINEKEFKDFKDVETPIEDFQFSPRAKEVEFAMRIACYCRHQEEKTPVGYRVIFTFKDTHHNVLAQHLSDIFQITDDHKNKEVPTEMIGWAATASQAFVGPSLYTTTPVIPEHAAVSFSQPTTPMVPTFSSKILSSQTAYPTPPAPSSFSQPSTPLAAVFPSHMHSAQTAYAAPANGLYSRQSPVSPPPASYFAQSSMPAVAMSDFQPFPNPGMVYRSRSFMQMSTLNTTPQAINEGQYLPRASSYDTFNFMHTGQDPLWGSAPQSPCIGPLSESRPASPTWEQGRAKKKRASFHLDG